MDAAFLNPKVHELFDRLLDLPERDRADFLHTQCKNEPELRQTLERLLAATTGTQHESAAGIEPCGALFSALWAEVAPPASDTEALINRRIGAYRLLENIGEGGMATVYLAERADGVFEHQVAFKLLRSGARDADTVHRFNQERQVLAQLTHPNVARLLDGGVTDDGVPYLVMDYVDGQPIDAYCAAKAVSTRDILRLILDVANAVAFAHRNLILHRDIKPSNVLVTDAGEASLLDFGIAKILDDKAMGEQTSLTTTALRPMTPRFASPEQISGAPMTTASDVYQLGCLLYLLLTGTSPHGDDATSQVDVVEAILRTRPTPPSSVTQRTGLRGDLDNICLKALSKQPDRRYVTAGEFIDDIERHLADQPIRARGDSTFYRLTRFVKRNALAVGATAVVVGVIAAQTLYYTARLTNARDAARAEADKAGQVSQFLASVFAETDPDRTQGNPMTARELLDRGVERIENDLADQPAVQAQMYLTMGKTYSSRGLLDDAEPLLQKSVSMRRQILGDRHPDFFVSLLELGVLKWRQGLYSEAEARLQEAFDMAQSQFGPDDQRTLSSQSTLGLTIWRQGRFAEAQVLQEDVVAKTRQRYGDGAQELGPRLNNLAGVYWMQARFDLAAGAYAEALQINRQNLGAEHPSSLDALNNLAMTRREQGRYAESSGLLEEVIALRGVVLGKDHPRTLGSIYQLATNYLRSGFADKAIGPLQDVIEQRTIALGQDHPDTLIAMRSMAGALIMAGRPDDAKPYIDQALDGHRAALGPHHYDTLLDQQTLGHWYAAKRRWRDALDVQKVAADALMLSFGPGHEVTLLSRIRVVQALLELGEFDLAGAQLNQLNRVVQETDDVSPLVRGLVLAETGRWLALTGEFSEASKALENSQRVLQPLIDQGDPDALSVRSYAALLGEQQKE